MERLLEYLNDEAWWGFGSSSFGEKRATRIACGKGGTSCPLAVFVPSVRRESRRTRVPWPKDGGCADRGRAALAAAAPCNHPAPSPAAPTAAPRRRNRSADT